MDQDDRPVPEPMLVVISGPMFSEKSRELIGRIRRAQLARWPTVIFKPQSDTRIDGCIASRNGKSLEAIEVSSPEAMLAHIEGKTHIGIDEAQFFDLSLASVVQRMLKMGKVVYVAGLNLDFRGRPFETMMFLEPFATEVDRRTAVCVRCGSDWGTRSQRISGGNETVQIGDETYEARCVRCFTGDQ